MLIWTSQTSSTVHSGNYSSTVFSRLNPSYTMCLCIHLPVFFEVALVVLASHCKSRTWACQYTGMHEAFQDVHGSWEPGCDKCRVKRWVHMCTYMYICGLLSRSMWGLLRLAPITVVSNYMFVYLFISTEAILQWHHQCDISYTCPGSWYISLMFDTCPEVVISTLTLCIVVTTSIAMVFIPSGRVFRHRVTSQRSQHFGLYICETTFFSDNHRRLFGSLAVFFRDRMAV